MNGEKKDFRKTESGEVMLESSFILVAVIILLMALLSISFLFYQKAMMTSIAAEVASDVAKNYKFATMAIGENSLSVDDVIDQNIFRTSFGKSKMQKSVKAKIEGYLGGRIALTSLGLNSGAPEVVECSVKASGIGRIYVTVKIQQKSEFFLSGILNMLNIWGEDGTFTASAVAECLDMTGYTSTVNFVTYAADELSMFGGFGDLYVNLKKLAENLLS